MTRTLTRRLAAGALTLALAASLAACGDDGDEKAAAATRPTVPTAACDAAVALSAAMGQAPEDPSQFGSFAEEQLVPQAEALAAGMPTATKSAGRTLVSSYEQIAEKGDPSVLESPEFAKASEAVGAEVHDGCDLEAIDVTAVDYRYEGVPASIEAGRVSLQLTNKGKEDHEMVVFRRADGDTRTWDELSKLPQDQMFSAVTFTGVAYGHPGSTSYAAFDLDPGTYFLVCSLPTGGHEDGAPHFMNGMSATLTVQ